jgi:hypothetical protein
MYPERYRHFGGAAPSRRCSDRYHKATLSWLRNRGIGSGTLGRENDECPEGDDKLVSRSIRFDYLIDAAFPKPLFGVGRVGRIEDAEHLATATLYLGDKAGCQKGTDVVNYQDLVVLGDCVLRSEHLGSHAGTAVVGEEPVDSIRPFAGRGG